MAQNENKDSKPLYIGSRVLNIFKYVFLILCCLIVIVPILVVLIGSLKTYKELSNTTVFTLPEVPQWENFKTAFFTQNILLAFKNTAIIIVVSCVGSIITGTMTAYVVQRFNTYFSRVVKTAFLIATLLPNITMQVTVFQIVYKLGLYRSMLAPIILNIGTDIISIYIFIQFLGQISYSLDESAIMDGASYPRVYFSIILPNLKPAIATVLIIKFVGIYNDFYTPKLYMPDDDHVVISTRNLYHSDSYYIPLTAKVHLQRTCFGSCKRISFISILRQHRTRIVRKMRSQIFCQIVQKFCRHTDVCQEISVLYDGKSASRLRAKPTGVPCAVLPLISLP